MTGNGKEFLSTQVTEARRYHFKWDPGVSGVGIICGGCERIRSDYVVEREDFPFFAIEFVAEGKGYLKLAGLRHGLSPGMAFSYAPGIAHRIESDPSAPMLKYYVDFSGKGAARLLSGGGFRAGSLVRVSAPHEISEIFELLQREGAGSSGAAGRHCAALLAYLILKIDDLSIPLETSDTRATQTYARARRTIEREFLRLRSVEEAARACGMDPAHLSRLFRRFARSTPHRFLTRLRMNYASSLLLDHGMLVKEVAGKLGYADAFHFSRTFKRSYGVSPQQFLRRSRGKATNAS